MADGNAQKDIQVGDPDGGGFGKVTVKANGVREEIHTDGSIVAYTKSDVDAHTDGASAKRRHA